MEPEINPLVPAVTIQSTTSTSKAAKSDEISKSVDIAMNEISTGDEEELKTGSHDGKPPTTANVLGAGTTEMTGLVSERATSRALRSQSARKVRGNIVRQKSQALISGLKREKTPGSYASVKASADTLCRMSFEREVMKSVVEAHKSLNSQKSELEAEKVRLAGLTTVSEEEGQKFTKYAHTHRLVKQSGENLEYQLKSNELKLTCSSGLSLYLDTASDISEFHDEALMKNIFMENFLNENKEQIHQQFVESLLNEDGCFDGSTPTEKGMEVIDSYVKNLSHLQERAQSAVSGHRKADAEVSSFSDTEQRKGISRDKEIPLGAQTLTKKEKELKKAVLVCLKNQLRKPPSQLTKESIAHIDQEIAEISEYLSVLKEFDVGDRRVVNLTMRLESLKASKEEIIFTNLHKYQELLANAASKPEESLSSEGLTTSVAEGKVKDKEKSRHSHLGHIKSAAKKTFFKEKKTRGSTTETKSHTTVPISPAAMTTSTTSTATTSVSTTTVTTTTTTTSTSSKANTLATSSLAAAGPMTPVGSLSGKGITDANENVKLIVAMADDNFSCATLVKDHDIFSVGEKLPELYECALDQLSSLSPSEQAALSKNLNALTEMYKCAYAMEKDEFKPEIINQIMVYRLALREGDDPISSKFPKELILTDLSTGIMVDENGNAFDNLRGPDGLTLNEFAAFCNSNGGDIKMVTSWIDGQGGDSWTMASMAVKDRLISFRTHDVDNYWWKVKSEKVQQTPKFKFHENYQGNIDPFDPDYQQDYADFLEKMDNSLLMWMAYNMEFLAHTDIPGLDRKAQVIVGFRTESHAGLEANDIDEKDRKHEHEIKRNVFESFSVGAPIIAAGTEGAVATFQYLPTYNVLTFYPLYPMYGDSEKEIAMQTFGVKCTLCNLDTTAEEIMGSEK